jgi:hypothetical protein
LRTNAQGDNFVACTLAASECCANSRRVTVWYRIAEHRQKRQRALSHAGSSCRSDTKRRRRTRGKAHNSDGQHS